MLNVSRPGKKAAETQGMAESAPLQRRCLARSRFPETSLQVSQKLQQVQSSKHNDRGDQSPRSLNRRSQNPSSGFKLNDCETIIFMQSRTVINQIRLR
jgi:hypothetical protein